MIRPPVSIFYFRAPIYFAIFKSKGVCLRKMTELNTIISQLSSTAQEGWRIAASRPEPELVENMKNMVSKWKSERWYGWKVTRKTVDPMLQCFVELGRLYLPQNTH